jgi:hypothetical protein
LLIIAELRSLPDGRQVLLQIPLFQRGNLKRDLKFQIIVFWRHSFLSNKLLGDIFNYPMRPAETTKAISSKVIYFSLYQRGNKGDFFILL